MLRRRAFLKAAGGSGPSLPYKLKQGTNVVGNRRTTVSDNSITDYANGTIGARNMYINSTVAQKDVVTTPWFQLHAGDVVTLKTKNLSYTNNYTAAATYSIVLKDASNTSIVSMPHTLLKNQSGTIADAEATATLASDITVCSFLFYQQRQSTVEYDIELWVNGVRYV